jgi:hypothetical protein
MTLTKRALLPLLAIFALLNASNPAFADAVPDQASKCKMVEKISLSLYYQTTLKKDTDFGLYLKNKISTINDIAKKLKLGDYKFTSRNMSINPNTYQDNMVEVSLSMSLEIPVDYKAVNHFHFESKAYTTSIDLFETEVCAEE